MASRVWRPLAVSVSDLARGLRAEDAVAGAQQRARQVVADERPAQRRRRDRRLQVDVDANAAVAQQVDEILGGDVAAGAGRERAAAESADRGVQPGDARGDGGVRAGEPGAAGVVEVRAERDVADQRAKRRRSGR